MDDKIIVWIISALVSIVIAIVGWILTYKKMKKEFEKEVMKLKYDHNKLLIQERLKYYPKLFEITKEIWKKKYGKDNLKIIKYAYEELQIWNKEWKWFMLLTWNSLKAFNSLKDALSKKPWNWDKWYTDKQLEKIFYARNALRWALKDDSWIKIEDYKDS